MKIKLLCDLPISPKHGMREGRVLEVLEVSTGRGKSGYWVMGDAGERVRVLSREASPADPTPTLNRR